MASRKVNKTKNYGTYSRLRFYPLVQDDSDNKIRIGMKNKNFINKVITQVDYSVYRIPPAYEYRPDLISVEFYGTPHLWWVIQEYNRFFRVPQDFYVDRLIKIPDSNELTSLLI